MIGLGESGYERQFWKSGCQKENLVTNCQTNSNRLSFFLTRALGGRVGPDFAGRFGRQVAGRKVVNRDIV